MSELPSLLRALVDRVETAIAVAVGDRWVRLTAGSKRLRGTLFLAIYETVPHPQESGDEIAAGLELIHVASTIIDDVQDGHSERWHRPSRASEGVAIALNEALSLLVAGQDLCARNDRWPVLNSGLRELLFGQDMDLRAQDHYRDGMPAYETLAEGKTASLLTTAVRMARHHQQDSLLLFAGHLGIAHQLQDDIDDLGGVCGASNAYWFLPSKPASPEAAASVLIAEAHRHGEMAIKAIAGLESRLRIPLTELAHALAFRRSLHLA